MAGAMLQKLPSHFDQFNENFLLIFDDSGDYAQYVMTKQFAVAKHTGEFCRFQNCKYHILLYNDSSGGLDTLLKLVSQFTFTYYEVDSLYGMFKYYITCESEIESQGQLLQELKDAVRYNRLYPHMETRPSILRKRLLRKKRKLHRREVKTKNIGVQSPENSLYTRIDSILKGNSALDFMRIIDCMIDSHGAIDSQHIVFYFK